MFCGLVGPESCRYQFCQAAGLTSSVDWLLIPPTMTNKLRCLKHQILRSKRTCRVAVHIYTWPAVYFFLYIEVPNYKLYDAFGGYLSIWPLHSRSNGFACWWILPKKTLTSGKGVTWFSQSLLCIYAAFNRIEYHRVSTGHVGQLHWASHEQMFGWTDSVWLHRAERSTTSSSRSGRENKKSPKGEKLFWGWQLMTQIDHRNELIW